MSTSSGLFNFSFQFISDGRIFNPFELACLQILKISSDNKNIVLIPSFPPYFCLLPHLGLKDAP